MASQALIKDFEDLLGKENVFSSEADRASYSYDSAVLPAVMPALVVRPTTAEQLGQCVKKLYDNGTNAVLIGETLMRAPNKKEMLDTLRGGPCYE